MYEFDLFVIGAGSGGIRAARVAAGLGARVALAEDKRLGGTCVNAGCVPKKLYVYASRYRYDFEDSAGFGWRDAGGSFEWSALREAKERELQRLNSIYRDMLLGAGVELFEGRARLRDAHTVDIGGRQVTAARILVATGGRPRVPDIPGRELTLTSDEIFDLDRLPDSILIVGGGYIGVEFAGIFAGLGAKTILCCRGDMPLRGFDLDIRRRYATEAGRHFTLLPGHEPISITRIADELLVEMKDRTTLRVSLVLCATGRAPNTHGLGLGELGIVTNADGSIPVNRHFQTIVPSIYAVGDVVGRAALTPVALAEGKMLAEHLFGEGDGALSYADIPTAVFGNPNIATVGLSEEDALALYPCLNIFEAEFRALRHTLSGRNERTYLKVVVDGDSDRVVGMHLLGADAGEIIQGFAVAINCGLTKRRLDATLGIHPTLAEEFVTLRSPSRQVGCGIRSAVGLEEWTADVAG